jgi:LPXTG-site transpeptidase (sortase) family protein
MSEKPLLLPSAKAVVVVPGTQPRYARLVRIGAMSFGLLCVLVGAADLTSRLATSALGDDAALLAFGPAVLALDTAPPNVATSTPGAIVPAKITIPSVGIIAGIEQVGTKADGSMGTPKDFDNVAWYALGPKPGEAGNAVFAGHVNNGKTTAGVFTHLNKVKAGDYVTVADESGRTKLYQVSTVAKYPSDEPPPQELFATSGPSQLVLITCEGDWVPTERTFSDRLVLTAKAAY